MAEDGAFTISDNSGWLDAALKSLTRQQVYVGIPETADERDDETTFGNAAIGYVQETGSPEANIPARPHLVPGVQDAQSKISSIFGQAGKAALMGDTDAVEQGLNAAGLVAVASVRNKITEVIPPPLAESTLAARRRRGRTGTTPLIDTGEYKNAITYVIRES